jgi:hypothetical protein
VFTAPPGWIGRVDREDVRTIWLHAGLDSGFGPHGLAQTVAHEYKHVQQLLLGDDRPEAEQEASCDAFAARFARGLERPEPAGAEDDVVRLPPDALAALRRLTEGYWAGKEPWTGQKHGPGGIEYSAGTPIERVR